MDLKKIPALAVFMIAISCAWSVNILNYQRLDAGWELYMNKSPELVSEGCPYDELVEIPHTWNQDSSQFKGDESNIPYGTYRRVITNLDPTQTYAILIKDMPPTDCVIYANNKIIAANGNPYKVYGKSIGDKRKSQVTPLYGEFSCDKDGNVEIQIFIANSFHRKSGLWDYVLFGKAKNLYKLNVTILSCYIFLTGILLFSSILNIIQFLYFHRSREYMYLGLLSFVLALRVITADYCLLGYIIPSLTYATKLKLEYAGLWSGPLLAFCMLVKLSSNKVYLRLSIFFSIVSGIIGLSNIFMSPRHATQMVSFLEVYISVLLLVIITIIIYSSRKYRSHIVYYVIGFGSLIIGVFVDMLYYLGLSIMPFTLMPFFFVIYIMTQIIFLAVLQNDAVKEADRITGELKRLNQAYLKFVPKEFLKLLNKDSITNIQLGDYSKVEMCVMYARIYVKCAESDFSGKEHFMIFNQCLVDISPIIKKYNGFVSKFLSGGFMALFPMNARDSIYAAAEIVRCLDKFNQDQKRYTIVPRIGINYGKMIIGTIGEEYRMDDTVISDAVNTSSRIEDVAEILNKNVIISYDLLSHLDMFSITEIDFRQLNAITVKGKEKPLELYECCVSGVE